MAQTYQGLDDLDLRRKVASLFDIAPDPPRELRRHRRRVGFVVTHPSEGPFILFMAGLVARLSRVDPFVVCTAWGRDRLAAAMPNVEIRAVAWTLPAFVEDIREAAPDILYFFGIAPASARGA